MLLNILKDCVIITLIIKKVDIMDDNKRREFLKKIVYKAPAVIALGTLAAPLSAKSSNAGNPFPTSTATDDEDSGSSNGGF